jgi:CheY-like chemotaxis protein
MKQDQYQALEATRLRLRAEERLRESEEGPGSSTFTVSIPLVEDGRMHDFPCIAASPAPATAFTAAEEARIPRLLLAEDDPANRQVLGLMFKMAHYTLDFAEDGLMAVKMWEKGEYDLLLMDIQMPVMDGFEATGVIRSKERQRGGHIPIIAMTAHAFPEDRERCLAAGMDGYISKPIDFQKCLKVVEQCFKLKHCSST